MEWASLLAGERWSDHPRCTHPTLARLARRVNDTVAGPARQRLVTLVPSVVGLTSRETRWDAELAWLLTVRALPVADSPERARALAAGLLTVDRVLAGPDGRAPGAQRPETRAALEVATEARAWAEQWLAELRVAKPCLAEVARHAVDESVAAMAAGRGPDRDARLVELLNAAVGHLQRLAGRETGRQAGNAQVPVGVADTRGWKAA
jgi:hypothetical protein